MKMPHSGLLGKGMLEWCDIVRAMVDVGAVYIVLFWGFEG
jgi:hypothetical protein